MKRWLLVLGTFLIGCYANPTFTRTDIAGAWRADSVFQYTNGFVERKAILNADENIIYDYDTTGRLMMRKEAEQRRFEYEIIGRDSLIYRTTTGKFMVGYRIMTLSPDRLVLKKKQYPLFPGPNQDVYEIRQFSPVTAK